MKKRLLSLMVLTVALTLTVAPVALADHCYRCAGSIPNQTCTFAVTGGRPVCSVNTSGACVFQGLTCTGPHPFIEAEEPLGVDFFVASVERLDEPNTAASETRIAAVATPQTAAQR